VTRNDFLIKNCEGFPMAYEKKTQFRDPHRWLVFGLLSLVYFFVYFHRVSTSVIATDLLAAFNTHATALGFMSSMYFYLYALEQPLVGYLSDRLGPRRVVGFWSLAAALGCVLFGIAPSIGWAALGRALIGLGVGGVYVPAMKALSQWFLRREFATMTGLLLACGNLGAIMATTPLAWMANMLGWRSSFFMIGGLTFGLAFATLFFIRDRNETVESTHKEPTPVDEQTGTLQGSALKILTSLRFWIMAAIFFSSFGSYLTFQGLWATPFLMTILNLDRLHAAGLTMLVPVGFILGAPLTGWLSDKICSHKANMLICILALLTSIWVGLTFGAYSLGTGGMIPLLLVMGGSMGGLGTILWALVRETTPDPILGLTTGFLNPSPFLGAAVLQVWTGAILDHVGRVDGIYPPAAYTNAFLVCLVTTASGLILCTTLRRRLSTGA
jgi:sugar phosphate permease